MSDTSESDLLARFGISDARIQSKATEEHRLMDAKQEAELRALRAVNGSDEEQWVPVTNMSISRGIPPNFTATAWLEVSDAPGEYMSVITLFRTNKGLLECFVPARTKYIVGVGAVGF